MVEQRWFFLVLICLATISSARRTRTPLSEWDIMKGSVPSHRPVNPAVADPIDMQKELLMRSAAGIIHGTNSLIWKTGHIREASDQCVSFEVGFVLKLLEESYRKMLDVYNTTIQITKEKKGLVNMRQLAKVERFHWEIYQLANMMHEIEAKYKMGTYYNGSGMFDHSGHMTTASPVFTIRTRTWSKKTTSWWHPLEYGFVKDYYVWDAK